MKVVTIISYPRTGSSLLIHQARSLPLCALLEIFHPDESVGHQHLVNNPYGSRFTHLANAYSRQDKINNISHFLADLRNDCPEDLLTFKVFPGHLPALALESVIADSSAILVHTRNRLQSFISDCIASRLQKWGGVNTSQDLVGFQQEHFCQYLAMTQNFLSKSIIHAIDHNVPILFSSFEKLRSYDSPDVQLKHVAEVFSHVTGSHLNPIADSRDLPRKQDTRNLASDKVSNADELRDFLEGINARQLNSNDTDIPYSRYQALAQEILSQQIHPVSVLAT